MAAKTIERAKGLYKNGNRWWMRVRGTPRSTGTADVTLANRIIAMVAELEDAPASQRAWLDAVDAGEVTLIELYTARAAGRLHELKAALDARHADDADADLDPWVTKWATEHLPATDITERQRDEYVRQVRVLIPEGARFPKSRFTEDTLKATLLKLRHPATGEPLAGGSKRRYVAAWRLFWKWARRRVPLDVNPFDDTDWLPANGSSRTVAWDHETTIKVLDLMPEGVARDAMTVIFGTGMEAGAVGALCKRHVSAADHTIIAPGTKNDYRENRVVLVNAWAWPTVERLAKDAGKATRSLWGDAPLNWKEVRETFYAAQVAAGLIELPPRSERTGKLLWGASDPHTIHDARHTYCYVRLLGLDGEPRQDIKFCSMQLGHADEQMVMKIYGKLNIAQRLRVMERAAAAAHNNHTGGK